LAEGFPHRRTASWHDTLQPETLRGGWRGWIWMDRGASAAEGARRRKPAPPRAGSDGATRARQRRKPDWDPTMLVGAGATLGGGLGTWRIRTQRGESAGKRVRPRRRAFACSGRGVFLEGTRRGLPTTCDMASRRMTWRKGEQLHRLSRCRKHARLCLVTARLYATYRDN
jgi:hypothetical protein